MIFLAALFEGDDFRLSNKNVIQLLQMHNFIVSSFGSEIVMNWTATKASLSLRLLICDEQNARALIQMSSSSNIKVKFFVNKKRRVMPRSFMLIWCTYAILFHGTIQLRSAQNAIFADANNKAATDKCLNESTNRSRVHMKWNKTKEIINCTFLLSSLIEMINENLFNWRSLSIFLWKFKKENNNKRKTYRAAVYVGF